jgi:hypothetical protein
MRGGNTLQDILSLWGYGKYEIYYDMILLLNIEKRCK